jgi:hypothetical protein
MPMFLGSFSIAASISFAAIKTCTKLVVLLSRSEK